MVDSSDACPTFGYVLTLPTRLLEEHRSDSKLLKSPTLAKPTFALFTSQPTDMPRSPRKIFVVPHNKFSPYSAHDDMLNNHPFFSHEAST